MSNARIAAVRAIYEGTDISREIHAYFKGFSFSDAISSEADTASVTLEDRSELWMGDWLPERGAKMEITLEQKWWAGEWDEAELPLGKFEIDEIVSSGPPNEAKIKMVSIPNNAEIRSVERTRPWEKTQLSVIANDVATGAGMELYYDAEEDPVLERAEQSEESDLSFLLKICKDAGLALKVTDERIVIFDVQKYEEADPVLTLTKGSSAIKQFDAKATINKVYKACHVKYKHSKKSELIEYTFEDPNKKDGMTLQVNEKVETLEEAEKLAKKKLREKNQEEISVSVTTVGNFALLSSNTVELSGFHFYDGKYLIVGSTHEIGAGGYTTKINLRRCLDGY